MRVRLSSQPEWDMSFRGWSIKFIKRNMWRCEGHDNHEKFNDLKQDAYLTFRRVLASYPSVSEPKHIMTLFKRAMINEYNDKASYRREKEGVEVSVETIVGEDLRLMDILGEQNNYGYLNILLRQLPEKIKIAINALQSSNELTYLEGVVRLTGKEVLNANKELTNSSLSRIIGLPKGTNLVEVIHSALLNNEDIMSETVSPVEKELMKISGFVPEKRYRKRQVYLQALTRAVNAIDDAMFEQLSDDAAQWADQAVRAMLAGKEVPDFAESASNGNDHSMINELDEIEISPPRHTGNGVADPAGVQMTLSDDERRNEDVVAQAREYEDLSEGDQHDDHVIEYLNTQNISVKVKKPQTPVKDSKPRVRAVGTNKWGIALGTKADIVCQLISRPGGATMKDIKEATGDTHYNLCNRLQRKGFNITKEGPVIKLLD